MKTATMTTNFGGARSPAQGRTGRNFGRPARLAPELPDKH